jgi:hypothetical protein
VVQHCPVCVRAWVPSSPLKKKKKIIFHKAFFPWGTDQIRTWYPVFPCLQSLWLTSQAGKSSY